MKRSPDSIARCACPLLWLVLLLASCGWSAGAFAAACSAASGTLSFGNVSAGNAAVGSTLATSNTVTITFTCSGLPVTTTNTNDYIATIQAGQNLATLDSTNVPAGPGITFATNLAGLAVLVKATPVQATSESGNVEDGPTSTAGYPVGSVIAPANSTRGNYGGSVSATYTAYLIKTGPVQPGTITTINLIPFWWYISGGSQNSTSATLNAFLKLATFKVTAPACTVSTASKNITVTLPSIQTSALSAAGTVAGRTGFNITLTGCPSGLTKAMAYFEPDATTVDSTTHNLKNKNGTAANVQVQLLNGNGSSAVAFSPILLGAPEASQNSGQYAVAGGAVTMHYVAQYFAKGAAAGAGSVNTSIGFTIDYP